MVDENYAMIRKYVLRLCREDKNFQKELIKELEPELKELIWRYAHLDPQMKEIIIKYAPVPVAPVIY